MRPRRGFDQPPEQSRVRINEAIRVPQIRLIDSPPGLTATPNGEAPTGTLATTVLVAMSITETSLLVWFVM